MRGAPARTSELVLELLHSIDRTHFVLFGILLAALRAFPGISELHEACGFPPTLAFDALCPACYGSQILFVG